MDAEEPRARKQLRNPAFGCRGSRGPHAIFSVKNLGLLGSTSRSKLPEEPAPKKTKRAKPPVLKLPPQPRLALALLGLQLIDLRLVLLVRLLALLASGRGGTDRVRSGQSPRPGRPYRYRYQ